MGESSEMKPKNTREGAKPRSKKDPQAICANPRNLWIIPQIYSLLAPIPTLEPRYQDTIVTTGRADRGFCSGFRQ